MLTAEASGNGAEGEVDLSGEIEKADNSAAQNDLQRSSTILRFHRSFPPMSAARLPSTEQYIPLVWGIKYTAPKTL